MNADIVASVFGLNLQGAPHAELRKWGQHGGALSEVVQSGMACSFYPYQLAQIESMGGGPYD